MLKRILTGAVILIITVGVIVLKQFSSLFFDAFALIIMYGCLIETLIANGVPNKHSYGVLLWFVPTIIFCIFVFESNLARAFCYVLLLAVVLLILCLTLEIFEYAAIRKKSPPDQQPQINASALFEKTKRTMIIFAYPILPLTFFFALNHLSYELSYIGVILIFVVSMLTDTFAYFVGMAFGKRKFIPEVSPKKTIAGVVGGALGGIIGVGVFFIILHYTNAFNFSNLAELWKLIIAFSLIGVVGSYVNQLGDLIESAFKRKAGIKDSSNIFPGHGGMLDRVDGQMLTSCFIFLVFALLLV